MPKIASVVLALLLCTVTAASAQRKMTVEELLKPYDANTRPDYVPPLARSSTHP